MAAVNAPSSSLVVYEAPNGDDAQAFDLLNRIASDDSSQIVTTSWGVCESDMPAVDRQTENGIFQRMALQGQTVIAASGDSGSEDCLPTSGSTQLAVDDPGSQPDVVSAGGTSLTSASPRPRPSGTTARPASTRLLPVGGSLGAGGGGYSLEWPANPGQPPATGPDTTPCGLSACRAVPDFSYPPDPSAGGVAAYWNGRWTAFGGTSVAAPVNAGLFADTNQGCFGQLGRVGPALYAAQQANAGTFTDITQGNNDFTAPTWASSPPPPASTPPAASAHPWTRRWRSRCRAARVPLGGRPQPRHGAGDRRGRHHDLRRRLRKRHRRHFGAVGAGRIMAQSATSVTVVPPNAASAQCVDVTVTNPQGTSAQSVADHYGFGGNLNCGQGYRFVASDGGIFSYGDAGFYGSAGGYRLNAPVVGHGRHAEHQRLLAGGLRRRHLQLRRRPVLRLDGRDPPQQADRGPWPRRPTATATGWSPPTAASSPSATRSSTARPAALHLNKPIVGMAATPDGGGYWLVASDGGIFSFGDAQFYGSTGCIQLNSPIVGMAAGPGGNGYWLVASDGGIFNYGSANFYGSAGSLHLNKPVVGMAAAPDAQGYWLVASDGGIFTYGNTLFYGSTGGIQLNKPIVGMSSA